MIVYEEIMKIKMEEIKKRKEIKEMFKHYDWNEFELLKEYKIGEGK